MPRMKTNDEFIMELKQINPNITPLEEYKGVNHKIAFECKIDGYIWNTRPGTVLRGHGCPKCGGVVKKDHSKFIEEVKQLHDNIEILSEYSGHTENVKCRCLVHDYYWETTPASLLASKGCPKCSHVYRRTHEEFILEMKEINPNIEILSKYHKVAEKVRCHCIIDDYEWETTPNALLSGKGCVKCAIKKNAQTLIKTHEEFIEDLQAINPNVIILDRYIRSSKKVSCKCKIDGYEWRATPNNLLRGKNCPRCAKSERYTTESFKEKLFRLNPDIEVLGEYITSQTKLLCRCKQDGYQWEVVPGSLLSGTGCPICSISKGETRIKKILQNIGIDFEKEKTYPDLLSDKGWHLRYDFYIPDKNLLIEYQGKQHQCAFDYFGGEEKLHKQIEHDRLKREYAAKNNIDLIEIWYWNYDNIETILSDKLIA